ncbi:hypothetical protein A2U01_0117295, partial [Trifolium medium]|nr:hypothetical protein [Trifolium medium]
HEHVNPITLISGDPLISDDHLSYGDLLSGAGDRLFVLPSQLEQ